ncbi:unnamed protein product [Caenorhabditis angaria]|uniref:Uncharacterized protein n=1 Tax=Caenorhabditis angaria TaxID=860376 RepID=A0A9P1MZV2_9PELO|nr:unnamed protein product [Caenorhabditis angaria]
MKDDDMSCINKSSNRRSTLTGYSSISSGIGSIASEVSEFGSFGGTIGRSASVSRNGSKRETDKERTRRFLKNVVISDIPAEELLKMKVEQLKRRKDRSIDEEFETQLDETGSSTSSTIQELLNFDVVALDINVDGTPYSKVGEVMINAEISKKIKDEMRSGYRSDKCGTIVECDPDIVFVCSSTAQNKVNTSFAVRDLDESVVSRASVTQSVLVNVRNSISKSIELWNSQALSRTSSTLLLFPMFCSSEEEWDAKDTIEAIYCMLDAMLNTKRWKTNGRVILAGLTSNNVRLLREKYNEMKLSIIDDCELPENESSIKQIMNDEKLRSLFASLATLTQQGPIPVQAYSMLAGQHSTEVLAEHMRLRWLSDGRFGPLAANILTHIHKGDTKDISLSSNVLALLLNDYRNRLSVRNDSRLMFRNSVKTLFAMYPIYVKMDECVSKSFIKPMFSSLDALIDDGPDTEDLETAGVLLSENGGVLHELNSYLVDRLIVKIRHKLMSEEEVVTKHVRQLFLHVYDLWAFGWSELNIPECLLTLEASGKLSIDGGPQRKNDINKQEFGSKESII